MKIENVLIVDPIRGEFVGNVEFSKVVVSIEPTFKKPEAILMPGFIDSHTHGAVGEDFMYAEDISKISEFFASQGVTTFYPTSVSAPHDSVVSFLKRVEKWMEKDPGVGGAHVEGPYISKEKKGAQNEEYIRVPDREEVEELLNWRSFKIITLAPEVVDPDTIRWISSSGRVVSLGHSNATHDRALFGVRAGATRITHFPNALRPLHHREVGIFGVALSEDVYIELIADLIHVSPEMVRLLVGFKGYDRVILVTDSISATGLEDGEYELGGLKVLVRNGVARLEDGTLAGSTLEFSDALKNFRKVTGCSLTDLSKVSSYNAAKNLGLTDRGRIDMGYRADLVVLDFDLNVLEVYRSGERIWEGEG